MPCFVAVLAALTLAITTAAWGRGPYDNERTPAGWAWKQIRASEIADFDKRCGKFDAKIDCNDPCRQISPQFLVHVLTDPKLRDQVVQHLVRLRRICVDDTIDLSNTDITLAVRIEQGRINGDLVLDGSHWNRLFSLEESTLTGKLFAPTMHTEGDILLDHSAFERDVDLRFAKIGGNLNMASSSFAGAVDMDSLSVARNLLMRDGATFEGGVNLIAAKVGGNLEMNGSSFAGVHAPFLSVDLNLFMGNSRFGGDVDLSGAKISGDLGMQASWFARVVDMASPNLEGAKVGGVLAMDGARFDGAVHLVGTTVVSGLPMRGVLFAGVVNANSLKVIEGSLLMNDTTFGGHVDLTNVKVGGVVRLDRATALSVNLSEAVAKELLLVDLGWSCVGEVARRQWPLGDAAWRDARCDAGTPAILPKLTLRNAHFEALQDSARAWPPWLDLEGFHYDRLGGLGGAGVVDVRQRSPERWKDWFDRDPIFSTQPYTQLSSVLLAAGHRDTAEAIQLDGRERARSEAAVQNDVSSWLWLTALFLIAGYGIGNYTFRVLWWVLGLTVLGFVFLYLSPNARAHSVVWRLGASLHRLLPIVKLSKEFEDFFDNPATNANWPRNLNRFLVGYFAFHAIFGWVLGLILLAAMGGITQKG